MNLTRYYSEVMMEGLEQPPKRCPITGTIDCRSRTCELHYMDAPADMGPEWAGLELNPELSQEVLDYYQYEAPKREYLD